MCNTVEFERPSKWLFKRNNFLFCLTIFLFFVFNNSIVSLINFLLQKNLGYTYPTIFKDFLFFSFFIATISFYWSKRNDYIPSGNITSLLLLYFIFYMYFRLVNKVWEFTPFLAASSIKYLDVFAVISILNSMLWLADWVKCSPPDIDKSKNTLFDDSPIEKERDDILGYHKYAKSLATKIDSSNFDKSFAIGINGYWGIGKTSFIHLLESNLSKDDKIYIKFNPWDCKTADAIIQDFFEAFQESIRPYHSSLSRTLMKYSEKLVKSSENPITNTIHLATTSLNGLDSLESIYIKINHDLKRINKKLIVFIDDLDRLDSKEVSEVLKLIRNTANFYNTFFIVAYDRNYVIKALKTLEFHRPQHFLEKIFQIEITLPQFDKVIFRSKLLELIKPHIQIDYHPDLKLNILGTTTSKPVYLDQWLSSMRDVTRLANSIVLNFSKLQGEIEFDDFLKLEILRLNYPSVYETLFRKTDEVLDTEERQNKRVYVLKKTDSKDNQGKYSIELLLNNECEEDGVNKCEIEDILFLLSLIFPTKDNLWHAGNRGYLSVIYPSNFLRYFNYELLKDDLSEVEFSKARKSDYNSFKTKIDEWIHKGYEYLVKQRFIQITEFDDKEDFEKTIAVIFYFAKNETRKDKSFSNLIGYEANDLHDKIDRSVQKKYYNYEKGKKDFRDFVLSLFLKKPPYQFEAAIINDWLESGRSNENFVLKQSELERLAIFYFAKYVIRIEKIDRMFWYYFHCCKYMDWVPRGDSGTRDGYKRLLDKAKDIVKYFILNKDAEGFLSDIIELNFRQTNNVNQYAISSDPVLKIWDSWDEFKQFIFSINSTSPGLQEFKNFYTEFEKTGHSKYIDFDFTSLPVRKPQS